jgi:hypothetical protein
MKKTLGVTLPAIVLSVRGVRAAAQSLASAATQPAAVQGGDIAALDTVTVVPGARYRAGWVKRDLFGEHHRTLWTTPLRVFRGDAALVGSSELRIRLARATIILPLWLSWLGGIGSLAIPVVRGSERTTVYAGSGFSY